MIMAPPIVSAACATVPSGPGRRTNSTASNVVLQKSIAAAGSRHTNIGIITGMPSGIGFTLLIVHLLDGFGGCPSAILERVAPAFREKPGKDSCDTLQNLRICNR